jgi:large subunit ribosomal protein L21
MYAVVSIAGQQFKVEKGKKVFVHRLPGEIGEEISFDKVLLISNDSRVIVGTPYLPDAVVLASILSHNRGDKVLVFKKKRRKGYQKLNGHRQDFTQILIEDIAESGAPKKTEKKKASPAKPAVEVPQQEAEVALEPVAANEAAPAKTSPKKTATKPAAEKPAAEKTKKAPAKKTTETGDKAVAKKAPAKPKTDKKS